MTTAYTSLLGLALPVTGELSGTWGDTVNNAITSLVDSAVAGTTTLSTDGDVTLTTTTGAANQARQAILLCTGARTAQRTITAPAQSKAYFIINDTTGGFAVKIVGAGPTTGVTVAAGRAAVVVWDSTDFQVVASSDVAALQGLGTGVATALGGNVGTAGAFIVNGGALGTPSSGTLTNATGLPISSGVSGLGTGVATALATNVGSVGAPVINGGALGTPSSGTLTNATGLPLSTGVTGILAVANGGTGLTSFGTGVATALGTNVGTTGAFVVNGGALGTPSSGTLTNATGLPVSTGISGLGTNVATALGTNVGTAGAFVVNGGALGTPSSGTLTNATGLPVSTGISGLGTNVATALAAAVNGAGGITTTDGSATLTNKTISGASNALTVDGTNEVGFRIIPQNSQSAAYTLVLSDNGKQIFHPSADTTARTYIIPANSSVAFPVGTAITFINQNGAGTLTIAITSDTMRLAGAGTTGTRSLAANGVATAIKIASTEWIISGVNLT